MLFSRMSDAEVERRRLASVAALREMERDKFARWYQEQCDAHYWSNGQCCAGCDFWNSYAGWSGECLAAGLVPADEVFASIGIVSWTGPKQPGFPFTSGDFWCGKFVDEFDWSALPDDYLVKIGAKFGGVLRGKPEYLKEEAPVGDR